MPNMDVWDWVFLAVGAFVAITTLVGLMRRRRDEVLGELTAQARIEQQRKRLLGFRDKKPAKEATPP